MRGLLAIFGALIGLLIIPLGLVPPTTVLLVPGHLLLTVLATVGALTEGLGGRPERARLWGFGYLVSSVLAVGALEIASHRTESSWWLAPWFLMVIWGWIPPAVAGAAGWLGEPIAKNRLKRVLRRRRKALR